MGNETDRSRIRNGTTCPNHAGIKDDIDSIKDHLWGDPTIREQINAVNAKVEKLASGIRILGSAGFVLLALIQIVLGVLRVLL